MTDEQLDQILIQHGTQDAVPTLVLEIRRLNREVARLTRIATDRGKRLENVRRLSNSFNAYLPNYWLPRWRPQ